MKKSEMPRVVLPFHIMLNEYVPALIVGVVNSIQLPVPVALSEIHWPLLEFASVCSDVPTPLFVTGAFSASNETVVPVEPVVTVNATFVLCDRLPLVPVIVSVELPAGVDAKVATVSGDEPTEFTEDGLKLPVAPDDRPATLSVTVPLKALRFPTFTV